MAFSEQVLDGERIIMALWFTRDATHDKDKKSIGQLMKSVPLFQDKLHGSQDCGDNTGHASPSPQVNMLN